MSDLTLLQLPFEILINILKNLTLGDIRNFMLTCKTLNEIILSHNPIWKLLFHNKLIIKDKPNSRHSTQSWYNLSRISHNWRHGFYKSKVIHHANYMPWLKFVNSEVLLLATGSELKCYSTDKRGISQKDMFWKISVPKVTRNDVRTNDISRFVYKDNIIVCGNRDGCAAVYNVGDIRHRPQLLYHIRDCHRKGSVEVSAVEVINNNTQSYIVTCSNNSLDINYWCWKQDDVTNVLNAGSLESFKQVTLDIIDPGARCLSVNHTGDKLAIGLNGNCKPVLLDVTTDRLLVNAESTRNVKHAVRDICWHNENTVSFVTHSGRLQFIDIRNGELIYDAMDPFQCSLYCLGTDGDRAVLVGSSDYSRCVLFDARLDRRHVQIYFSQKKSSPIYSLDFDSSKLIAAADRGAAVLNFNVNSATTHMRDYSHAFEIVHR